MRKLAVVLVGAMILLAGCSGGGGGAASPTEEVTDTPANETSTSDSMESTATPTPDDSGSQSTEDGSESTEEDPLSGESVSSSSSDGLYSGATVINTTLYNGTQESTAVLRNETSNDRELTEFTGPSGETDSVYRTADYVAYRNGTSGDVEYGEPDSFVGSGVELQAGFTAIGPLFYFGLVEWETSSTEVDGQDAIVYEGDSLNESGFTDNPNTNYGFEQSEVQSVDGEVVISTDGQLQSVDIEIETEDGTYGGVMSISYDDITITQPSWVDESQAP